VNPEDDFIDGGDAVPLCVTSSISTSRPPPALLALDAPSSHHNFRSRGHNGYVLPLRAVRSLARGIRAAVAARRPVSSLSSTPTRARSVVLRAPDSAI